MVNAVTYILENNETIQGLVGVRSTGSDYKVFPGVVFESEKGPYIVVRQSGQVPAGKNCGHVYTIDVISYAKSYDAVQTLTAAVRSALEAQGSATVNSVGFGFLNFVNEVDGEFLKDHLLYTRITTFEGNAD